MGRAFDDLQIVAQCRYRKLWELAIAVNRIGEDHTNLFHRL